MQQYRGQEVKLSALSTGSKTSGQGQRVTRLGCSGVRCRVQHRWLHGKVVLLVAGPDAGLNCRETGGLRDNVQWGCQDMADRARGRKIYCSLRASVANLACSHGLVGQGLPDTSTALIIWTSQMQGY